MMQLDREPVSSHLSAGRLEGISLPDLVWAEAGQGGEPATQPFASAPASLGAQRSTPSQ